MSQDLLKYSARVVRLALLLVGVVRVALLYKAPCLHSFNEEVRLEGEAIVAVCAAWHTAPMVQVSI